MVIYSITEKDYINSIINMLEVYPGPESNRHGFKGRGILSPLCLQIPALDTNATKIIFHRFDDS